MYHNSDFFLIGYVCYGDILFRRRFVTGDVMLWRRSVTETFCRGDVLCGDVLYVRHTDFFLIHINKMVYSTPVPRKRYCLSFFM
jgi:hypothetical protein